MCTEGSGCPKILILWKCLTKVIKYLNFKCFKKFDQNLFGSESILHNF